MERKAKPNRVGELNRSSLVRNKLMQFAEVLGFSVHDVNNFYFKGRGSFLSPRYTKPGLQAEKKTEHDINIKRI